MGKLNSIVEWCLHSMETEPQAWRRDNPGWDGKLYYVTHIHTGVTVWMANSTWGLGIYASEGHWSSQPELGGVTGWSTFFGWATPWRVRLYRAAKRAVGYENAQSSVADTILDKIKAAA